MNRSDFIPLSHLYREIEITDQVVNNLQEIKSHQLRTYSIRFESMKGLASEHCIREGEPLNSGEELLNILLSFQRTRLKTMQALLDQRLELYQKVRNL